LSAKTLTAKVLLYLRDNPGATLKDLAQAFNLNPVTARSIIYRLKSGGYVEKAGNGYTLTSKGEWFVSNVILKGAEKIEMQAEVEKREGSKPLRAEEVGGQAEVRKTPPPATGKAELETDLLERLSTLEKEVESLREAVKNLAQELAELKKKLGLATKPSTTEREREEKRVRSLEALPKPVMNLREALEVLGPSLDRLRGEGRVEVIGSLVVDKHFYESFKKKFPIPLNEVDNLDPMEKLLLEEMRRDARVIIHAGREYRLVA